MGVGSIYRVILSGSYLGQQITNVWHYAQLAGGSGNQSGGLSTEFQAEVLANLADCVASQYDFTNLLVVDVQTPSQFTDDSSPTPSTGARTIADADLAPSYLAFGFRSNRNGPGSRYSYKRFPGLSEVDFDGNALTATFKALADPLRAALGSTLVSGANQYFPFQIPGGVELGQVPPAGFVVNGWNDAYLTTQNSRKPTLG